MEQAFVSVIEKCQRALESPDPQASVEAIVLDAAQDPAIAEAISRRTKFASLEDLAIHRSESPLDSRL
jgi:hypothetical protein